MKMCWVVLIFWISFATFSASNNTCLPVLQDAIFSVQDATKIVGKSNDIAYNITVNIHKVVHEQFPVIIEQLPIYSAILNRFLERTTKAAIAAYCAVTAVTLVTVGFGTHRFWLFAEVKYVNWRNNPSLNRQ